MLEFIVLGKVPGTHLQITYAQVLTIALGLCIAAYIANEIKARRMVILRLMTIKQLRRIIRSHPA